MRAVALLVLTLTLQSQWALAGQVRRQSESPACLVVSGLKREGGAGPFAANHPELAQSSVRLGSLTCAVVSSWREIRDVEATLPAKKPLLILQGAHGTLARGKQDVTFHCDRGAISGKELLGLIEGISFRRKVGAVISSCYSGRVLHEKLSRDEDRSAGDPRLSSVCLLASSVFSRPSHVGSSDLLAELGSTRNASANLNQYYLSARSGLSSAAPWSAVGWVSFAKNPDASTQNLRTSLRKYSNFADLLHQKQASWAFFEARLSDSSLSYLKQAADLNQVKPLLKTSRVARRIDRGRLLLDAVLGVSRDYDLEPLDEPGSRSLVNSDDGFQSVSLPAALVGFSRGGILSRERSNDPKDLARYQACQGFELRD